MKTKTVRRASWGTCLLFALGCTGCAPGKADHPGSQRETRLGYSGTGTGVLSVVVAGQAQSEPTDGDPEVTETANWSAVQAFSLNLGTGELMLEAAQALAAPCPGTPTVSTSGRFYLLPDACTNEVTVAHLALTGNQPADTSDLGVEEIDESPYRTELAPVMVAQGNSGKYAYVLNRDSNSVGVYRSDPDTGRLTLIAYQSILYRPRAIAAKPSGRHIYVAGGDGREIAEYAADPMTGLLSRRDWVETSDDVRALRIRSFTSEDGTIMRSMLYAITRSTVVRYELSSWDGTLHWRQTVRLPSDDYQAPAMANSGYLYVANRDSIAGFSLDPTDGKLEPVPGSPFPAGAEPTLNTESDDGSYSGDWESSNEAPGARVAAASGISGRFLFVTNRERSTLSSFAIEAETGRIAELDWSPRQLRMPPTSVVVVGGVQK